MVINYDKINKNIKGFSVSMNNIDATNALKALINQNVRFGKYHKAVFHLHTPQSLDYKVKSNNTVDYSKKYSEKELISMCVKEAVFEKTSDITTLYDEKAKNNFDDKKEFLAFMLLAKALIKAEIEIVAVTDHNVLSGAEKLEKAISILGENKESNANLPVVFCGVEISCADMFHVVGIFPKTKKSAVSDWLKENLFSEMDGSFRTSRDVLNFFNSINAISYIAHFNTSKVLSGKRLFSGKYMESILSSDSELLIGINKLDLNTEKRVKSYIGNYYDGKVNFILDSDSHAYDNVHEKVFWIKGGNIDYPMLREAITDYEVSISLKSPNHAKQYIKGIYISDSEKGFLKGKQDDSFSLLFSDSLNCFIGGRGTGKSTVLKLIDFIMAQNIYSLTDLEFICQHGNAYILYELDGKDYIIEMILPFKSMPEESILNYYGYNERKEYYYKYNFDSDAISEYTKKKYVNVYAIDYLKGTVYRVKDKQNLLDKMFDRSHSVNELVKKSQSESEINDFIFEMIFKNETLSDLEIINSRSKKGLINELEKYEIKINNRKEQVNSVLEKFNDSQKGVLKIEYSMDGIVDEPDIDRWLLLSKNKYFNNYNIKGENVKEFLLYCFSKLGAIRFVKALLTSSLENEYIQLLDFVSDRGLKPEITILDDVNARTFIRSLCEEICRNENIESIKEYIKKATRQSEKFVLKFNINSSTTSNNEKIIYKPLQELSLGQRVVALLDFVLGFSDYAKDYRPLIIDQPEDNLDSRYIYLNLVKQLRGIKEKRQVIISTHNATIVTNSMADQVCVMESDGENGWIEKIGYPSEARMKKKIVNYLEGGKDSFKHKQRLYKDVLD